MKKASTRLLEQETQTPSPAPDLIPAESSTENLHWDWYSKRGHFSSICILYCTHIRALRVRLEYRKSDAISDFTTNPKYFPKPGCGPELEYVGKRVGKGDLSR